MAAQTSVAEAAARLREAERSVCPCLPVRDLIDDVESAYAVQAHNNELAMSEGRRRVGWKVGLTSAVVQRQLGVDQPDFGMLFADREVGDDLEIPLDDLLQPRVEAEVAFVLGRDLPDGEVGAADILSATAYLLPAIEVVASRIVNWDISIADTIADNASTGRYILGGRPTPPAAVDLREVTMVLTGPDGTEVSSGSGAACLGHPVNAVVWLANTLRAVGSPLGAGDLILSGALGPMVPVDRGGTYEARLHGLGSVRARFGGGA